MKKVFASIVCLAWVCWVAGCSQQPSAPTAPDQTSSMPAIDGAQFLLGDEPAGATEVVKAREDVSDGDDIVIVGRIGGSRNPWIDGRAAFSIVDGSLKACRDIPGDTCEKPWDYCCATDELSTSTALVKVVDDDGEVIKADAKQLLDVQELSTVVVKGKAKRDDAGNLTVLADSVFVKQR